MRSEFCERVDDLLRDELMNLGLDYSRVVQDIVDHPSNDGCVIRMRGEYDDVEIVPQTRNVPANVLTAQIARKLKVSLMGTAVYGLPREE